MNNVSNDDGIISKSLEENNSLQRIYFQNIPMENDRRFLEVIQKNPNITYIGTNDGKPKTPKTVFFNFWISKNEIVSGPLLNEMHPFLLKNRGFRRCCLATYLLSRALQMGFQCGNLVAENICDELFPLSVFVREISFKNYSIDKSYRYASIIMGIWEMKRPQFLSFKHFVSTLEAFLKQMKEDAEEDGRLLHSGLPLMKTLTIKWTQKLDVRWFGK